MQATSSALVALHQALEAPRSPGIPLGNWRWVVRQRMVGVRDALAVEAPQGQDSWLAARGGSLLRERNTLLTRLSHLGPQVLECPDVELIREELLRLMTDIRHHTQRVHDLLYDDVGLELGGSE